METLSLQLYILVGLRISKIIVNVRFIFYLAFRSCSKDKPNHAITIVGQTENQDWIVRNSWGESWGNNGYYVIKKGNTCGICNTAFVPYFED
jgi:hypothetical protein